MGIDYDASSGYGVEIDIHEAKLLFGLSDDEFKSLEEGGWSMEELSNEDYYVQSSGDAYSGDFDYWFTLKDEDIVGLEGRCIGMKILLKHHGIDKEPYWYGEISIW